MQKSLLLCYNFCMRKYFKYKINSLLVVRRIISIHYIQPEEKMVQEEENHDFWELVLVDKGNAVCTSDGKQITLNEGQVIFHQPNERHTLVCDNCSALILSFDCLSEAMRFFSQKLLKLNKKQMDLAKEIAEIAKKTYDITFYNSDVEIMNLLPHPTLGGEQLIKNYLETLLIDIMRSLTETEYGNDVFLKEKDINNKLADDIIKILKENLDARLTIEDISKKISYSKAYIFRQFKIATGKTVIEYYQELKINLAKEYLLQTNFSVKEISHKLGFDTPNYFTKTFKKLTGKTPLEYKKRAN